MSARLSSRKFGVRDIVALPARGTRPAIIRPRQREAAARAARLVREAARVRRRSNASMVYVAAWTSLAFMLLGWAGPREVQRIFLEGAEGGLTRLALYLGFSGIVAVAAISGIVAARKEDAALERLRGAAPELSAAAARRLIAGLARGFGDESREAIAVLRTALEREPAEVAPAVPAGGGGAEIAPPSGNEPA